MPYSFIPQKLDNVDVLFGVEKVAHLVSKIDIVEGQFFLLCHWCYGLYLHRLVTGKKSCNG